MDTTSKQQPHLHHLTHSQSIRILFALEELSLAFHQPYSLHIYHRINMRAPPELQSLFPLGKSPILEIPPTSPGADAAEAPLAHISTNPNPSTTRTILTESRLILTYLATHYAQNLWTPSPEDGWRDKYIQDFAIATLAPTTERIMLFDMIAYNAPWYLRPFTLPFAYPLLKLFMKDLAPVLQVLEDVLADGRGEWLSGKRMGVADLLVIWSMDLVCQRGWLEKGRYVRLEGWMGRVRGREAYRRAVERGGGYDLKRFGS